MTFNSRRSFIKSSMAIAAFSATDFSRFAAAKEKKLSFSTLGCPDWTFDQIVSFAKSHGYSGIEIRGVQRKIDLTQSPHFDTPVHQKETLSKVKDNGLKIVVLGSSSALHHAEPAARAKSFTEAKQFIDIAHNVNCSFIRVFPDKIPDGQSKEQTLDLMSKGLSELGAYAKGSGVKVLVETHGDLLAADDVVKVMKAVNNKKHVGLVWDISNMWTIKKEDPADVYAKIKNWIHHTHLKDMKQVDGKEKYTLLGMGEVPIFQAIDLLEKGGYDGYYSFEWEKLWHPEIDEPEVAIAQFALKMKEHFAAR